MNEQRRTHVRRAMDVLLVIRHYLDSGEYPSYLDITFELSISPHTVSKSLRHLQFKNALSVYRSGRRNQYEVKHGK